MLTPEILFKTETILLESTYVLSLVSHSFSNFPLSQVFTGEKDQNSCSKGSECCLSCTLLYHWSWNKVGLRSFLKNESKIQLGQVSIISRLSNALWVSKLGRCEREKPLGLPVCGYVLFQVRSWTIRQKQVWLYSKLFRKDENKNEISTAMKKIWL